MMVGVDPQLKTQDASCEDETLVFARTILKTAVPAAMGARAGAVNRTHRVVRQRASVMQARRKRVRGLMVPLVICSVLLLFTCAGLWIGLDQYQAAEIQDVGLLATTEASRHFLVVLLWFVPLSMALLAVAWFRRDRSASKGVAR
jgi:hypothetical protein